MKTYFVLVFLTASLFAGCNSNQPAAGSPGDVLKQYVAASQKQDIAKMKSLLSKSSILYIEEKARPMKLLLSEESLKMHEQEAKAQNTTVDEIVKRETLFSENQTQADYRNQKIEDDKATIEMRDSAGIWNTVHFVREDGVWKIDKKGFVNQIEQLNQQKNNELDQLINNSRIGNVNENQTKIGNTNANQTEIGNTNENQTGTGNTNEQP